MSIITAERATAHPRLIVLDLRDRASYLAGHIPGAIRLDLKRWEQLAKSTDGTL